jgi:hypothetical protein
VKLLLSLSSVVGFGVKSYLTLQRYCPVPAAVGNGVGVTGGLVVGGLAIVKCA